MRLIMFKKIVVISLLICSLSLSAQEKWEYLFDGKTLSGWTQKGGSAPFKVQNGAIVGTTAKDEPNSFICTEKEYGNFILELEFKVDPQLNSGVQFRSFFEDGVVRGYQYEIDPDKVSMYESNPSNFDMQGNPIPAGTEPRSWTGGIYDEKRRGWIGDLTRNPEARAAFIPNQWNKIRVEAIGAELNTWINGVHACTVIDYLTPNGFIALQVHAVSPYKKMKIMWRNIRIQDLGLNPAQGDVVDVNVGEWSDASSGWLAQTKVDQESGKYFLYLSDMPYERCSPTVTMVGELRDGSLLFSNEDGWSAHTEKMKLIAKGPDGSFNGVRVHRLSTTLGMPAPEGAEILFDGNDLNSWGGVAEKEWLKSSKSPYSTAKIVPGGYLELIPGQGSLVSNDSFRDYHMHLEFRMLGEKTNGGVYLQSRYELNLCDSWAEWESAPTGAFGNIASPSHPAPSKNWSLPPMTWQTLDVDFVAPRLDNNGKKVQNARVTAYLNGQLVYDNVEVADVKGATGRLGVSEVGPIYLQEHGTPYQFRNIWVLRTQEPQMREEHLQAFDKSGSHVQVALNAYSFKNDLNNYVNGRDGKAMTLFDLVDYCVEHEIPALDPTGYFFPGYPETPSDEYIYALKRYAHLNGVQISGTGVKNNFASTDPEERRKGVELVKNWIDVASKLGAPVIRTFAGAIPEGYEDRWDEVAAWMIECYKECASYGESKGVLVGVQNHGDMLQNAEQVIYIVNAVDSRWFGTIVDTGYMMTEDPYKDIEKVLPYAVNFQVKESPYGAASPIRIDLARLMKILHNGGYKGYLPVETLSIPGQPYDPYSLVPPFIAEVKQAIEEEYRQ